MGAPTCPIHIDAPEEVFLEADPDRIRQALENLLSNAIKYSPDGVPIIVQVGTERREDGEWAFVSVRDKGPGISPDMMSRLFTRFSSSPDSTGLGLGLYLARGIAHAHGGTLTVESMQKTGTTFKLSLPVTPPNS